MKPKKINARSKELESAMKELYSIKNGGVPPELAIQEVETLIETIEHQEAEINYLHDIMIKRGEQMVYEEMYNDMKKLADKQEKEIVGLKVQRTGYQDIIQTQEKKIKELEEVNKNIEYYKCCDLPENTEMVLLHKKDFLRMFEVVSKDRIRNQIKNIEQENCPEYSDRDVINILEDLLEEEKE